MPRQHTIGQSIHVVGVGVHTGRTSRLTLRPAPAHHGIRFHRSDIGADVCIPADPAHVSDTFLATTLAAHGHRIVTVEHLMSALWGLNVDNVSVDVAGDEVPILDGSAEPFVALIRAAGIVEQAAPRAFIRIKESVKVTNGDAFACLHPFEGFKACYTFVADHPVYNRYPKRVAIDFSAESFVQSVGIARSFGLISELRHAQSMNRCLGSSLDNAVGVGDDAILNREGLRCPDEFVKHKILDAIGDLYLLGKPILGAFEGYKSGHTLNTMLAQAVLENRDAWEIVARPTRRRRTFEHGGALQPALQVG